MTSMIINLSNLIPSNFPTIWYKILANIYFVRSHSVTCTDLQLSHECTLLHDLNGTSEFSKDKGLACHKSLNYLNQWISATHFLWNILRYLNN